MSNKTVRRLQQESRRGHPIDSGMLRDMGVSAALAAHMVKSGWLQRLSQGIYLLTGDTPSRDGSIVYLGRRIPGLHVGCKAALSWQRVRHNIAFREKVVLWGQTSYRIPPWVVGLEADLSWARDLQKHVDRLGAGKRWSNKTKNGRLTLKPQ